MDGYDADRTQTGSISWVAQMLQYVRSLNTTGAVPAHVAADRKRLCDCVLENPASAEEWWQFLQHEEAALQQSSSGAATAAAGIALRHLYHRATELVLRCKGRPTASYVHIWLGYARHQW